MSEMNDQPQPKKMKGRPLSLLDRLVQGAHASERPLGNPDDPANELYPTLVEWLTRCSAGKDHVKTPAKLSIQASPEGWIVSLVDPDLSVSMDTACLSLNDALPAVERALTGVNPPIRNWGRKPPTLRKRRTS